MSAEAVAILCFLTGMFGYILGYIANSDFDEYDQL